MTKNGYCQDTVSIVIITYNQSKYIFDTLESTRLQTYQNIELIISDDCSTDDTVEICTAWLKKNSKRFFNTKIIISPQNTGTAINCNRGVNASTGKWIKLLAGDDSLPPESVAEYIDFMTIEKCNICCCKLKLFGEDQNFIKKTEPDYNKFYTMIDKNFKYQKKMNARELFIPGPGLFFLKNLFDTVNGFDEKYPFAEEWPFTTKILNSGNKIFLLDKYLYNYRIHAGSLCRNELEWSQNKLGLNKRVFFDTKKYFYNKGFFVLLKSGDILYAWHLFLVYWYLAIRYNSNQRDFLFKCVKLVLIFSPLAYIKLIKRIIRFKLFIVPQ